MNSCFGSLFSFLIFIIVFVVILNSPILGYMGGSLQMFNDLMIEVFKSLITFMRGGVYIPTEFL